MATRFYLPNTGASAVNPSFTGAWTETATADRIRAVIGRQQTAMTNKATAQTATAAGSRSLSRQFVSDPIAAQTLAAGTVKGTIRALESAVNDNVDVVSLAIYVFSNDGNTLRGTVLALGNYGPVAEFNTTLRNKRSADGDATSSVVAQDGDRLVFEIGFGNTTIGTSINATLNYGDNSATDLADNETGTTADNPFIELSIDVVFLADRLYRNAILATSGLVAYWPMDELTGSPQDAKGTNHVTVVNGTPVYDTPWLIARERGGIYFPADTAYFTVPDASPLDRGDGPFSLEGIIRRDTDTAGFETAFAKLGGTAYGYGFTNGDKFQLAKVGTEIVCTESGTTAAGGAAIHWLITRSATGAGNTLIYKAGVEGHTDVTPGSVLSDTAGLLAIGREGAGNALRGALGHAAIYDRVLTADEAKYHAALAAGVWVGPPRLTTLQAVNRSATY